VPSITDFSAYSNNGTAWDLAANAAISAILSGSTNGDFTLNIPGGQWQAQGGVSVPAGVNILGAGKLNTVWNKAFNAGAAFSFTGTDVSGPLANGGGRLDELTIYATSGYSPGFGLYLVADSANHSPDFFHSRNLMITGPGLWTVGVMIDGSLRVAPNPPGVRDVRFDSFDVFGCSQANMYLKTAIGLYISNSGFFTAFAGAVLGIIFDGVPGYSCDKVTFSNCINILPTNFTYDMTPTNSVWNGQSFP
jgi:hypothetical protein